jgi:hypothetical protein
MNNNQNNDIKFEDLVGNNQSSQAPNNQPPIWEVNNNGGKKGTDTYSLVSMILGIASLVLCCTAFEKQANQKIPIRRIKSAQIYTLRLK